MRASLRAALPLVALMAGHGPATGDELADCAPQAGETSAVLDAVTPTGDVRLSDGRLVRLKGFVPSREARAIEEMQAIGARFRGLAVRLDASSAPQDRWGRWPAALVVLEQAPTLLALELVENGAGLADPAGLAPACRAELFGAEERARHLAHGLWRAPAAGLIDANAPPADVAARIGRFVLMEGQVSHTGEGRQRAFIDFGRRNSGAATLAIPRRRLAEVLPPGLKLAELRGKRLRARGILEWTADRPYMTLETGGAIEVLE